MESKLMSAFKVCMPPVLSLVALGALIHDNLGNGQTILLLHPFGFLLEFPIEINKHMIITIILILAVPCFLSMYLLYDYSKFLPRRFSTQVFYDVYGIKESLREFPSKALESLPFPPDYPAYQSKYFQQLDADVKGRFQWESFFDTTGGEVHSKGYTNVLVRRERGLQKYYLSAVQGDLTHILEAPNLPKRKISTTFQKIDTGRDFIQLRLEEVFVHRAVFVRTLNAQFLQEPATTEGVPFRARVVGLTKIRLFPWPDISRSVYFAEVEGNFVPVAYARYQYGDAESLLQSPL